MAKTENKPAKWLEARWSELFAQVAQAQDEDTVARICEAEMDAWRERPNLKSEQSLRRPITDTQAEIARREGTGELSADVAAWARTHLNFTKEKWDELNAPTRQNMQRMQENQLFLTDVDEIVRRLARLLESQDWAELAVGLAGCVGARPIEVLQSMELERVSAYSVMFYGQAKKRGEEFPGYEKPTLAPAGSVIRAWARLRGLLPTQEMQPREVSRKFAPKVKIAANHHFADLIPVPPDHEDLYSHLFRSVYVRIATLYYCPIEVTDLAFFSAICGHFDLVGGTEEQLRDFAASQHYVRYQILNAEKQLDGRHGIKLQERGVKVLQIFQKPQEEQEESAPTTVKVSAVRYRVHPETDRRLKLEAARRGIEGKGWADDVLNALLDDPAGGKLQPEQFVSGDIATGVREVLAEGEDFQAFLEMALRKEVRFRRGVESRYEQVDVSSLPTSKLTGIHTMDAARERYRRAVAAIAAHNDKVSSPNDRWYINTTSVHNLVGGKFNFITAYLNEHAEEINELNAKYNLTQLSNRKAAKINDPAAGPAFVQVPE